MRVARVAMILFSGTSTTTRCVEVVRDRASQAGESVLLRSHPADIATANHLGRRLGGMRVTAS